MKCCQLRGQKRAIACTLHAIHALPLRKAGQEYPCRSSGGLQPKDSPDRMPEALTALNTESDSRNLAAAAKLRLVAIVAASAMAIVATHIATDGATPAAQPAQRSRATKQANSTVAAKAAWLSRTEMWRPPRGLCGGVSDAAAGGLLVPASMHAMPAQWRSVGQAGKHWLPLGMQRHTQATAAHGQSLACEGQGHTSQRGSPATARPGKAGHRQ